MCNVEYGNDRIVAGNNAIVSVKISDASVNVKNGATIESILYAE